MNQWTNEMLWKAAGASTAAVAGAECDEERRLGSVAEMDEAAEERLHTLQAHGYQGQSVSQLVH